MDKEKQMKKIILALTIIATVATANMTQPREELCLKYKEDLIKFRVENKMKLIMLDEKTVYIYRYMLDVEHALCYEPIKCEG